MDAGGEIAVNLRKLYSFILSHISTANIKNDQKAAQEVIDMLSELKEGWQVITQ